MIFEPAVRKYIYGISVALVPLLIAYGAFSSEEGALILNVIAAILAVGNSALAFSNVETTSTEKLGSLDEINDIDLDDDLEEEAK